MSTAAPSAAARIEGLSARQLMDDYGLCMIEGGSLAGTLSYERPAFLFDPRRLKNVSLGAFSYVNGLYTSSLYNCRVGRYCSIAEAVVIGPPEHPADWFSSHPFAFTRPYDLPTFYRVPEFARLAATAEATPNRYTNAPETVIGHDVWIGAGAFVKAGVQIGDGAIVAAHAVVTQDVAPYTIVAGVPAKPLRLRFSAPIVERMLAFRWWQYDLAPHKADLDFERPQASLDLLAERLAQNRLQRLEPETYSVTRNLPAGSFDLVHHDRALY